jgi:regulator of PEP synthase PpsR (kinase-PPPase family)
MVIPVYGFLPCPLVQIEVGTNNMGLRVIQQHTYASHSHCQSELSVVNSLNSTAGWQHNSIETISISILIQHIRSTIAWIQG